MIRFNIKVRVNDRKLNTKRAGAHKAAQIQLDQDVLKGSNYFIPKQTGNLERSGILHTRFGSGKVIWKTKYARYQYYGVDHNFSADVNPNSAPMWFEYAKQIHKKDWLKQAKKVYRKYFDGR